MKLKNLRLLIIATTLFFVACKDNKNKSAQAESKVNENDIISTIINDKNSFYYIDFNSYPKNGKNLPVGIFDSGTGGLTVLDAILNYDENNNESYLKGSDGVNDFNKENFIYLADQANMPYGSYPKENNEDLLKEHIIKDAQFLMGDKYYSNSDAKTYNTGKNPIKAIVIACNTATAVGKEYLEEFLKKANSKIKVIGVIDAGSKGALSSLKKDEDAIIGVFATIATVSFRGYDKAIDKFKKELGYTGNIEVFSQGGLGMSEAIDEDPNYYDKKLKKPRDDYKGPSLIAEDKIDKALLDIYNFDFKDNKMLCDTDNADDCSILQINDATNYVRYFLVSLMEQIRLSNTKNKLKSIILGCTHYPYITKEINMVLNELYNYKNKEGKYIYRQFMVENIELIDPAINTAKELFDYLESEKLFNENGSNDKSEFYISVPNKHNPNNVIDDNGRFPYDYKYGRKPNQNQEFIKVVPFSDKNISDDIYSRLKEQIPNVYQLIDNHKKNIKANNH